MATTSLISETVQDPAQPVVRRITVADLKDALMKGWNDFAAMPSHAILLCVVYPVVGIFIARIMFGYSILPLLFPMAAGFALLGPVAAIGLYELSRRREAGLDLSAGHALDVLHSPSLAAILALGGLLMIIFLVWLAVANAIYVANFGYAAPTSIEQFARDVLTTRPGHNLIIVGNGVGLLFSLVVLTISVISFPLLLDRNVGITTALMTSLRAVMANPVTMLVWGLIVAALLVIGSLPLFLGLVVVVPVLGHATWHLYRKTVEPDPNPHVDYVPTHKPPRYAADFPASLFPWSRERE